MTRATLRHGRLVCGAVLTIVAALLLGPGMAAASDTPIADAAERGDRTAVQTLIDEAHDVDARQVDGMTALHWATYHDDLAMLTALLDAGTDVAPANRYGVTPLSLAAENGNVAAVERLLAAGADPNTTLPGGETVLMTAARTGRIAVVRALVARGANVHAAEPRRGQTALMWAAAEGHAPVVETLLELGVDFRTPLESGFTPLLFAVREGHIDVVTTLLAAGADVHEQIPVDGTRGRVPGGRLPRPGVSALHIAVWNAHYELAATLLDAGADPNANGPGYTVLHALARVRKPGGGDNNPAPDGSGRLGSLAFVRTLAAHGADLDAPMTRRRNLNNTRFNEVGATPFMLAALTADADYMRTLAELGANPAVPNEDFSTPLMAAAGLGTRSPGEDAGTEAEVVEALQVVLELGADVDAVDTNGETAMHGAAYKNLPGAVHLLAEHGASIEVWNQENRFGWTPLTIARGYRFGNFKPSPVTVTAIETVLTGAGVSVSPEADAQGVDIYAPRPPAATPNPR